MPAKKTGRAAAACVHAGARQRLEPGLDRAAQRPHRSAPAPVVTPSPVLSPASAAAILNPPHPPVVVVGPNTGTLPATNTVAPAAVMARPLSASEQRALDQLKEARRRGQAAEREAAEEAGRGEPAAGDGAAEAGGQGRAANRPSATARPRKSPRKRRSARRKKDAEAARLAAEQAKRVAEIERDSPEGRSTKPRREPRKPRRSIRPNSPGSGTRGALCAISLRHFVRDERGMSLVFVCLGFMAMLSATTLAIDVGMFMTRAVAGAERRRRRRPRRRGRVRVQQLHRPHRHRAGGEERDERGARQHGHGRARVGPSRRTSRFRSTPTASPTACKWWSTARPCAATRVDA